LRIISFQRRDSRGAGDHLVTGDLPPRRIVLLEVHDEWQVTERRYLSEGSMAKLYDIDNNDDTRKEVGTTSNQLLAG
jgi:hypothetical protein